MKRYISLLNRTTAMLSVLALLCIVTVPAFPVKAASEKVLSFSYINPLYEDVAIQLPLCADVSTTQEVSYNDTLADAGAVLREAMKARAATVTIGYAPEGESHTDAQLENYAGAIFDEATKHTGEPTEGDYLLWHYYSYGGTLETFTESGKTYITYTFNLTYFSTAQQEQQLDSAVDALIAELDVSSATDYAKVCAIYDYMCENISYDTEGLTGGSKAVYTAYAALMNKKAVCQGYASLFYRLALSLGVDARLIAGYGNGGRHGWNIVELADTYYNLDTTWDAARRQSGREYAYFLREEQNFDDHERYAEYDTVEFHTQYPMSTSDYAPSTEPGDTPPPAGDTAGYCGENVTWELLADGTLQIAGTGAMTSIPWEGKTINAVEIGDGVTTVCASAFSGCEELETVTFGNAVQRIGDSAFLGCKQLTEIQFPDSLQWIGSYAFSGCDALTHMSLSAGVISIGDYAFQGCSMLTLVNLPEGTLSIGKGAFSSCTLLQKIQIPDTVYEILEGAFSGCYMLPNITLPSGMQKIDNDCFKNCPRLITVTIPSSVTVIGDSAFEGCSALTNVFYGGNRRQWAEITLGEENAALASATVHCAVPLNGWVIEDGKWAYYRNDVKLINCWMKDSVGWCYLGEDGYCVTNCWQKDSVGWCYLNAQGRMATNCWVRDSKGWCYLGADGYAVTNCWKQDSHGWCYLDANGSMTKSAWVLDGGKWYYCDANGYMVANKWMKDSKGWVYLGANGAMLTNAWVRDSVGWCYVGADGYAVTNCWKKDSVGWCYLNSEGSMTKSAWVKDGGKWYYCDANGYMVANKTLTIGGKKYTFNASGVCTNP